MNLRQLRYFLAVAEEQLFRREAVRLTMALTPLSMQIKQLEADLQVTLFERTKRRVSLTAAGEALIGEAEQILHQVEVARQKTQQAARGETGQLAIAFVSSAMYSILPAWIQAFRQRYPQVGLTFQEATSQAQIEGLLSHQLDIGFVHPPIDHDRIEGQTVWREPMVVALPQGHWLSEQTEIAIAALAQEPFILIQRSLASELHDKIVSFCQQANFSPNIVQTAQQLQTILGLVAAQLGVAILPAAAQKLQREGVCYRSFAEETPAVELLMIWRQQGGAVSVADSSKRNQQQQKGLSQNHLGQKDYAKRSGQKRSGQNKLRENFLSARPDYSTAFGSIAFGAVTFGAMSEEPLPEAD
ncbi:MAG: LysR family transcriptional regulator [Phormidesmis sp.]